MAEATGSLRQRTVLMPVLVLMVASGFAGLGYQIVWTQQASLWLGHESAAVLAVITAFFGGLALGALTLGRRIDRSAWPARWYAACEVLIAVWSLVLAFAMAPISNTLLGWMGAQPTPVWQATVAFLGCFLLLLPATAAMGATLPAMERVLSGLRASTSPIAALYACNTLGAMLGVLATAFWLVPSMGLARTAAACAVLNLLCAGIALVLAPRRPQAGAASASSAVARSASGHALAAAAAQPAVASTAPAAARKMLPLLAVTGLLGIGYEVLVVRVLSQVTENTVYTFAILLAIYLLGTALGAAIYARASRSARWAAAGNHLAQRDKLLAAVAWACLAGTASLWAAEHLRDWPLGWGDTATAGSLADGTAVGGSFLRALAGEALPALLAFALPTLAMGALFSHLATQARQDGVGLGLALGANTLGAALAAPLVAWVLVPALGSQGALLLVALGYVLLTQPARWPRPWVAGAAVVVGATAVLAPPLAFIDIPDGGKVLSYREGSLAAVSVVADADGVARLRINNRQQEGSSATLLADARQALLPALLHPAPERALFLGLGTGVTAWAAAADPRLQVDAAELLPEVIAASALFRTADADAGAGAGAGSGQGPRLIAADARRFIKAAGPRYDLIVSDNFHPARSGSGLLYTVEHFRAVRERLAPGGLFCQWLPLHQLDLETLRSVVQSFLAVYPNASAVLATNSLQTPVLGLVARPDVPRFRLTAVQARLVGYGGTQRLVDFGFPDAFSVLGSLVADAGGLLRFAGAAPLNTDDRPLVSYRAPRITYVPDSLPAERLQALLREFAAAPVSAAGLVDAGGDASWPGRLTAYWLARDRFIDAGRAVRPSADARQMLAQVQAPLLAVLQTSPDFRPAFDPLQRMAQQLQNQDPAAAQDLMAALAAVEARRAPAFVSNVAAQP